MPQRWDGLPVVAAEVVAGAAIGDGADQDGFPGAVVVAGVAFGGRAISIVLWQRNEVKDGGGEVADFSALLPSDITSHRQSLQINLWAGDGAADVEVHAPFELLDRVGEDQEVSEAGLAERCTVAVRQTVNDVAAHADVAGAGDSGSPACSGKTQITMRELLVFDDLADRFAESFAPFSSFADHVVQAGSFLPQTELPDGNPPWR